MFSPPKFPINADGKRKVGMGWVGGGGGDERRPQSPRWTSLPNPAIKCLWRRRQGGEGYKAGAKKI